MLESLDSRFSEEVLPVPQVQNLIPSNLEKLTNKQKENIKTEFKSDLPDFFNIDSEIEQWRKYCNEPPSIDTLQKAIGYANFILFPNIILFYYYFYI